MKKNISKIFAISIIMFLCSGILLLKNNALAAEIGPYRGNIAPNFTLTSLNNKRITLSDYRGKAVFLHFFATWCPPCRQEMPEIEKMSKYFKNKKAKFRMVVVAEDKEGAGKVSNYLKSNKLTFGSLIDSDQKIGRIYKISAIPTTLLVDKYGKIRYRLQGAVNWSDKQVRDVIMKMSNEKYYPPKKKK